MISVHRVEEPWSNPTLTYRSGAGCIDRFPCQERDRDTCPPARLPTLGFVHRGMAVVRLRGRDRHVDANQLLLLHGGPFPMRHLGPDRGPWATALTLSAEATRRLAPSLGVPEDRLRGVFSGRVLMQRPDLQKRAHLLAHAVRSGGPGCGTAVDRRLVDLFGDVADLVLADGVAEPFRQRSLKRVRAVLASRFDLSPTLAELAATAHCTRHHLCRLFKAETGLTMTEYRHRLRLDEAALGLSAGRDDLATLAMRLGYASHSHFTSRFRRHYGVTPSKLREQMRRMAAPAQPAAARDVRSGRGEEHANRGTVDHAAPEALRLRERAP